MFNHSNSLFTNTQESFSKSKTTLTEVCTSINIFKGKILAQV